MKSESEQVANIFGKNIIFVLFLTLKGMLLVYFIIKYEKAVGLTLLYVFIILKKWPCSLGFQIIFI